jgi:hypothetical protein
MTRVEDIQNRLSAATPGPWTLDRYDHGGGRAYVTDPKRRIVCDAFKENDREFLFNSASDLAYLLAELRKAREALERVEALAHRLTLDELRKIRDLWAISWGRHDRTYEKLCKAIEAKEAK